MSYIRFTPPLFDLLVYAVLVVLVVVGIVATFSGCSVSPPDQPGPAASTEWAATIKHNTYRGHAYIRFGSRTGMVHDPDCACLAETGAGG